MNLVINRISKLIMCGGEKIPGIVLSKIKPKKPPTNILVVRRTCSTWSSSTTPKYNNAEIVNPNNKCVAFIKKGFIFCLFIHL